MSEFSVVKVCAFFCVITSVVFEVNGISVVERFKRAPKKCDGFRCTTSGKCIKLEKKCDGKVDCPDGSDEFNDCNNIDCPSYLFTCDYGACIDKQYVCDGKKDCRDNSDETNCIKKTEKVNSNCKSNQFQCLSGQCIKIENKCDGKEDCKDGSDETKETCLNMNCPGFTFVCDTGACVNGFAECDGVKDCIDNSDEQNCRSNTTTKKPPTATTPPPTQISGGCVLPEHPANGKWKIEGGFSAQPGTKVGSSTILTFECDFQYKLSTENNFMACLDDKWTTSVPKCQKVCPALYTTELTKVTCYDDKKVLIKCDSATDGSSASFECAPYYEPADRSTTTRYCFDGLWSLGQPICVPVCGQKRVSTESLIVNGVDVLRGDYPWVAAIYKKMGGSYTNICGGSMLTQRVIITAAHCVTIEDDGKMENKDLFKVAVGKYYNSYMDPRDTQAQYTDVNRILVHDRYRGSSQKFASDIALIITKDQLLLSKVVQPVCYQNLPNIHLDNNMKGVITGWGFTKPGGDPADNLKEIAIPFKDDATCLGELPAEWTDQYYTYDKMCAGHYNQSTAVCKGDSGGGLVFPHSGRYYIHGLVSVGHWDENINGCDVQMSALYTRLSSHYEWLERITAQYQK